MAAVSNDKHQPCQSHGPYLPVYITVCQKYKFCKDKILACLHIQYEDILLTAILLSTNDISP